MREGARYIHVHTYMYMYICIHMCTNIYIYVNICVYLYMYTCIYIYIYIHMRTYTLQSVAEQIYWLAAESAADCVEEGPLFSRTVPERMSEHGGTGQKYSM